MIAVCRSLLFLLFGDGNSRSGRFIHCVSRVAHKRSESNWRQGISNSTGTPCRTACNSVCARSDWNGETLAHTYVVYGHTRAFLLGFRLDVRWESDWLHSRGQTNGFSIRTHTHSHSLSIKKVGVALPSRALPLSHTHLAGRLASSLSYLIKMWPY